MLNIFTLDFRDGRNVSDWTGLTFLQKRIELQKADIFLLVSLTSFWNTKIECEENLSVYEILLILDVT